MCPDAADARITGREGLSARVSGEPFAHGAAQGSEMEAAIVGGELFRLVEAAAHERAHAFVVSLLMMIESGGDLDDSLEESFVRLGGGKPDSFPGFVGVPEAAGVELAEAEGECGAFVVGGHGSILMVRIEDSVRKARGPFLRQGRHECPRHLTLSKGGATE